MVDTGVGAGLGICIVSGGGGTVGLFTISATFAESAASANCMSVGGASGGLFAQMFCHCIASFAHYLQYLQ